MTIYRGPGGGGSADTDAEVNQLAAFALEAENSAAAAAASAVAAAASAAGAAGAEGFADDAAASAAAALVSQNAAAASAAAALISENAAEAAQTAAELAETNAEAAQTAAQLAETNAETAETNAAASAVSAASSASTATTQAGLASTSASNAATSASNAATSASGASTSASNAASSASSAAASYDSFDDRYLGAKSADPTLDNDGNALLTGALYWNAVANEMRVYSGSAWLASYIPASGYVQKTGDTMSGSLSVTGTVTATTFSGAGTSLTGTASALSIGGNAATATTATNQSGGTVSPTFITYPDNSVQNTAPKVGMVNRIINGAMVIDQRNAGASVTPANGAYTVDRWQAGLTQTSKYSVQQNAGAVTPPSGYTNYLGVTSLSAYSVTSSDTFTIRQHVEGFNTADLGWGTAAASAVTLYFWVRSSLTGTFGGSLRNSASDRSYPFTYTINAANTWELEIITIAGDTTGTWVTNSGIGITVLFSLGSGSNFSGTAGAWASANYVSATGATSVVGTNGATFYITGVQLEKGSTATSFDYRPYGTELGLCQRYYEKSYSIDVAPATATDAGVFDLFGSTDGTANIVGYVKFSVAKRANPTMSFWTISGTSGQITYARSGATASGTATTYRLGTLSTCFYVGTGGNWVVSELVAHWAASSEL